MSNNGAAWGKFSPSEEIAELLKRSAVLQGKTHQAGDHVVETDQFRGTVRTFHAQKDLGWMFVVMHADVERALIGNSDFLCDVMTMSGKGKAIAHEGCSVSEAAVSVRLS